MAGIVGVLQGLGLHAVVHADVEERGCDGVCERREDLLLPALELDLAVEAEPEVAQGFARGIQPGRQDSGGLARRSERRTLADGGRSGLVEDQRGTVQAAADELIVCEDVVARRTGVGRKQHELGLVGAQQLLRASEDPVRDALLVEVVELARRSLELPPHVAFLARGQVTAVDEVDRDHQKRQSDKRGAAALLEPQHHAAAQQVPGVDEQQHSRVLAKHGAHRDALRHGHDAASEKGAREAEHEDPEAQLKSVRDVRHRVGAFAEAGHDEACDGSSDGEGGCVEAGLQEPAALERVDGEHTRPGQEHDPPWRHRGEPEEHARLAPGEGQAVATKADVEQGCFGQGEQAGQQDEARGRHLVAVHDVQHGPG